MVYKALHRVTSSLALFPYTKKYGGREYKLVAPPDLKYCTKLNAKEEQRRCAMAGGYARIYKRRWITPEGYRRDAWVVYYLPMRRYH